MQFYKLKLKYVISVVEGGLLHGKTGEMVYKSCKIKFLIYIDDSDKSVQT